MTWPTRRMRSLVPGLALTAAGVAVAAGIQHVTGVLSLATFALLIGMLAGSARRLPARTLPGRRFAAAALLRLGVVLLGLKLSAGDLRALGWETAAVILSGLVVTYAGTRLLGRALGVGRGLSLLIGTGFAICGASAIAAMAGVRPQRDEDVAVAVGLVTLCGSASIVVLPLLQHPLGLDESDFGLWVGASVHDVGQVVATAGLAGPLALAAAVVAKVLRVAMLGPVVTGEAVAARRDGDRATGQPLVPLFVVAFVAAMVVRSTVDLPAAVLDGAATAQELALAAALFALGSSVDLRALAGASRRALVLGLLSWCLVAGWAYAGIVLT